MLIFGIIVLIVFAALGIFLIVKGVRQGDEVDIYGSSGKLYIGLGIVVLIFAIGLSTFCFVKDAELNSMYSSYDDYDDNDYSYDDDDDDNKGSSSGSFTNKYGTRTTKCAIDGCNNYIAPSGDTNCCISHSNTCGECYCYIDSDAMYCMSCISGALSGNNNNSSSTNHACYVCGDTSYSTKYGSYYYCSDCLALVKAFSD